MPVITDTVRDLLASCRDPLCPGYEQVTVRGIEREMAYTYGELGGTTSLTPHEAMIQNMTERSTTQYVWIDQELDEPCPVCGRPRILDANQRPEYERKTGMDPLELVKRERGLNRERDDREAALALQREQLAETRRANDLREREVELRERELRMRAPKAKAPAA